LRGIKGASPPRTAAPPIGHGKRDLLGTRGYCRAEVVVTCASPSHPDPSIHAPVGVSNKRRQRIKRDARVPRHTPQISPRQLKCRHNLTQEAKFLRYEPQDSNDPKA